MSKSSEALAMPHTRLRGTRLDGVLRVQAWAEGQAPRLLIAAMAAYVVILFAAIEKHLVGGLTAGSVK
jgi:ABC-type maltose transport system permease subunit